ncbi:MAG: hypothetical protein J7K73_02725 [Nanoarchaeota archaeon]|nr:hypothetical protein [Nanoarchaeota archaeon]
MEQYELAKVKVERIIKLSEKFEEMDEDDFRRFIYNLGNVLHIIPNNSREKQELEAYVDFLNDMDFKKYGFIFKGISKKGSVKITKKDIVDLVWRTRSLLF